jgi:hypothetical protein
MCSVAWLLYVLDSCKHVICALQARDLGLSLCPCHPGYKRQGTEQAYKASRCYTSYGAPLTSNNHQQRKDHSMQNVPIHAIGMTSPTRI